MLSTRGSLERNEPQVGNVAIEKARTYLLDRQLDVILEQIDPHEAEAGIAHFAHAEPRKLDRIVAHRMIVRRAVLGRNVAHRLADRLAQPHAHLDRLGRGADAGNELQAAVNLAAEVEQNRRPLALFGRKDGLGVAAVVAWPLPCDNRFCAPSISSPFCIHITRTGDR